MSKKSKPKIKLDPVETRTDNRCKGCPLQDARGKIVNTEVQGKGKVRVFVIGEAPGKTEVSRGQPFVGISGRILRRVLRSANGGHLKGVALGNVCRCLPLQKGDSKTPTPDDVARCHKLVLKDIEKINPDHVILVGKTPLWALATDPRQGRRFTPESGIFPLRGKDYVIKTPSGKSYPAVCTFHPAYILRNPKHAAIFEEDIKKVFLRLKKDYPDNSRRGKPATTLDTLPRVKKYLKRLLRLGPEDPVALDFETAGVGRLGVRILTVGLAHSEKSGFVIPYQHKESPWTAKEFRKLKKILTKFFKTFRFILVAHNLKFETNVIKDVFGVSLHDKRCECTMLRAQLLAENRVEAKEVGFGLKNLVEDWLQFYHYHDADIAPIVDMRNNGLLEKAPLAGVTEYNAMDCYAEYRLYTYEAWMAQSIWGKDYLKRFERYSRNLSGPASVFASYLERNGLAANKSQIRYFMGPDSPINKGMQKLEEKLKTFKSVQKANQRLLERRGALGGMSTLWGEEEKPWVFTLSRPEARRILYLDVLGLKPIKKTPKGQPKIDDEFYKAYKETPEVAIMAEWSAFFKLKTTYIEGIYKKLQNNPDMRDGRIRGRLNLHKAVTGRTTFDKPNMQNIPRGKTENAKEIKRLFVAGPGRVLVCGDYSQAEVRWMAEIAKDRQLIEQYKKVVRIHEKAAKHPTAKNGLRKDTEGDFHASNASKVFKKKVKDVSKNERSAAKNIVFGNIYGQGIKRLAAAIGCSPQEAKSFQEAFFAQFPEASKWLAKIEKVGFSTGVVESPLGGRTRHLSSWFLLGPEELKKIKSKDRRTLDPAEDTLLTRKAFEDRVSRNAPIQGVASDTNLLACIRLTRYIEKNKKDWLLVNVVHDSIIADIPFKEVPEYIEVSKKIMEDPKLFEPFDYVPSVPFMVDFSIGYTWGDQVDVSPIKTWKVKCSKNKCEGGKVYAKKPTSCPRCGGSKVKVSLVAGPAKLLLKKLKKVKRE